MATIDYEKKYKKALGWMQSLYKGLHGKTKEEAEHYFPELKESEDERIRKVLKEYFINSFQNNGVAAICGVHIKDILAWLEKQKVLTTEEDLQGKEDVLWCIKQAKKHAKDENEMGTCWFAEKWLEKQGEKPIDKIQIGKQYKCIASPRYSTFMRGKIYKPEDKFLCSLMNFCYDCFEPIEDGEQKPVNRLKITAGNWYVCEMEVMNENMITAFHRGEVYYCPKDGYIDVNGVLCEVGTLDVFRLATKEEIPQQKQEWSEEDDRMLDKCIKAACSNYYPGISSVRDWLRSLKNRYTWKPSDLPHWKKSTLPDNTTGFNSDYFCYKGYNINYKELFEKLPKDGEMRGRNCCYKNDIACEDYE